MLRRFAASSISLNKQDCTTRLSLKSTIPTPPHLLVLLLAAISGGPCRTSFVGARSSLVSPGCSCDADLGSAHDSFGPICVIYGLSLCCWFLWCRSLCSWAEIPRGFVLSPSARPHVHHFAPRGQLRASAGTTLSGFIAANDYWPIQYWWSVGLTAFSIILVILFLEESSYDRTEGAVNRTKSDNFIKDRIDTFFPGNRLVPNNTWSSAVS